MIPSTRLTPVIPRQTSAWLSLIPSGGGDIKRVEMTWLGRGHPVSVRIFFVSTGTAAVQPRNEQMERDHQNQYQYRTDTVVTQQSGLNTLHRHTGQAPTKYIVSMKQHEPVQRTRSRSLSRDGCQIYCSSTYQLISCSVVQSCAG